MRRRKGNQKAAAFAAANEKLFSQLYTFSHGAARPASGTGGAMFCCQIRTGYNIAALFLIGRVCAPDAQACADLVIKPNAADLMLRLKYIVVSVVIIRNVNDNALVIRAVIGTDDHVLECAFRHRNDLI